MLPAGNCLSTPCTVWFRSMAPPSSQRTTKEEQRLQKPGNMMPSTQRPLLQRSTRQLHAFLTTTSRSPSCNDRQNSMSGQTPWLQAQVDVYAALFDAFPISNDALCMADISQSLNRGSTSLDGSGGTVTTSTKLACIAGKHDQLDLSGRLLQPKAHLEMMGYSCRRSLKKNL